MGVPELPDPSPRFRPVPPTRHASVRGSRGDWTGLPSRGHVRTRGCPAPHSLPSRLNARPGTLIGRVLSPRCRRPRITHRTSASPRLSIESWFLPRPGIPRHEFSGGRLTVPAFVPRLARAFIATPRRRPRPGFERGKPDPGTTAPMNLSTPFNPRAPFDRPYGLPDRGRRTIASPNLYLGGSTVNFSGSSPSKKRVT